MKIVFIRVTVKSVTMNPPNIIWKIQVKMTLKSMKITYDDITNDTI